MDEQAIQDDFAKGKLKYWEAVELLSPEYGMKEARRMVEEWCDTLEEPPCSAT